MALDRSYWRQAVSNVLCSMAGSKSKPAAMLPCVSNCCCECIDNFVLSVGIMSGLITSFDVHHQLCWLALGTSKGAHICWDMRFQLPVTTVLHPTGNTM